MPRLRCVQVEAVAYSEATVAAGPSHAAQHDGGVCAGGSAGLDTDTAALLHDPVVREVRLRHWAAAC